MTLTPVDVIRRNFMANYFKDRVVEHPGRVTLTPTGGTNEYDVDRAEGTVSEAGSPINATTLNTAIDTYGMWYGTCSTSANTAEKVVTCAGFTLTTGAKISIQFTTANRVQGRIYLNVNGTGPVQVLVNDQYSNVGGSCTWDPGHVVIFTYDGLCWRIANGAIINDDELDTLETALNLSHDGPARLYKILSSLSNFRLSFACGTCTTAAETAAKVVTVPGSYSLVDGGLLSVKFTNSILASATMNVANTGAKAIKFCGSDMIDTLALGGATVLFVYKASDDTWNVLSVDQAQTLIRSSSAWVGTSQYSGHYFADATLIVPSGYVPVSSMAYSVTNNHYADVTWVGGNQFRVWTREPNISVYFRALLRRTS